MGCCACAPRPSAISVAARIILSFIAVSYASCGILWDAATIGFAALPANCGVQQ
jgi:hypothetical protein